MNNDLFLLIKKHTETLMQQTKTKPQETLEIKMNKQSETLLFNPAKKFFDGGKRFLAVTSFGTTKLVFIEIVKTTVFQILYQAFGFREEVWKL